MMMVNLLLHFPIVKALQIWLYLKMNINILIRKRNIVIVIELVNKESVAYSTVCLLLNV